MQFTITGKRLEVTPPIHQYAEDKTNRFPRLFDRIQQVHVIIDKADNHAHEEVEIIVHIEHAAPLIASKAGPDLYACIDDAASKIERQLRDHKEKLRDHKH